MGTYHGMTLKSVTVRYLLFADSVVRRQELPCEFHSEHIWKGLFLIVFYLLEQQLTPKPRCDEFCVFEAVKTKVCNMMHAGLKVLRH